MRIEAKFRCYDCGRKFHGKSNLVLRQDPCSGIDMRVNVCDHCQKGIKPEKRSCRK